MPLGLVNAPSVFQTSINELIKKLPSGEDMEYQDDIIILSQKIEEWLSRLQRFRIIVKESGLTYNDKKIFMF